MCIMKIFISELGKQYKAPYIAWKIIKRIDFILDTVDLTSILEVQYLQIRLHNDANEVV